MTDRDKDKERPRGEELPPDELDEDALERARKKLEKDKKPVS